MKSFATLRKPLRPTEPPFSERTLRIWFSPGNLQEIMNRVLAAERMSQAQLVEARTKAEVQRIEAQTRADAQRVQAQADAESAKMRAEADAEGTRLAVLAEVQALEERRRLAAAYQEHPALLRLEELATLKELGKNANARLYLDFAGQESGVRDQESGVTSG